MNFVPHLLWKESLMWEQSNQFLSKSMIITNQVNKKIKDLVSISTITQASFEIRTIWIRYILLESTDYDQ